MSRDELVPPEPPAGESTGPDAEIGCQEALARIYEYLDGELDAESQEQIHRHLEICKRCYPFFNFERLFLDYLREKGMRVEENPDLRRKVQHLLEEVE